MEGSIVRIISQRRKALDVSELADILTCSEKQIYRLVKRKTGALPSFRVGTLIRFDPASTAKWVSDQMSKAA